MEGEVFPGFPLRAMSHADVISGALTEICFRTYYVRESSQSRMEEERKRLSTSSSESSVVGAATPNATAAATKQKCSAIRVLSV